MTEAIENEQSIRIFIDNTGDNCHSHNVGIVQKTEENNYSDIIDNEYVITEVVYYFSQERKEQYFEDFLAVNYNDPFYRVLYSLGFKYVTSNQDNNEGIHGFYDFVPGYNRHTCPTIKNQLENGFEWMEKTPANGMKRVWVRSKLICTPQPIQKEGSYFLSIFNKEV